MHYNVLQYSTLITPHHNYNCNYTTLITSDLNYGLQLQLHDTTTTTTTALHHTTSNSCGEVTTATIATTPKNTTPTTFRSISGFALPSVIHNNQPLLEVSYFWNFRHRLVRYYWYNIPINQLTFYWLKQNYDQNNDEHVRSLLSPLRIPKKEWISIIGISLIWLPL